MFAAITSVSNCTVKTKPGYNCSYNIPAKLPETTAHINKIGFCISASLLLTWSFAALKMALQHFEMATSRIQSQEEQRLFVSLLTIQQIALSYLAVVSWSLTSETLTDDEWFTTSRLFKNTFRPSVSKLVQHNGRPSNLHTGANFDVFVTITVHNYSLFWSSLTNLSYSSHVKPS